MAETKKETSKADLKKVDPKKADAKKEVPKEEAKKEPAKKDVKQDAPKNDAAKKDVPKVEVKKPDPQKPKKPDQIKLKIINAEFTKDNDNGWMTGKQDPLIEFKFAGKTIKTKTKDEAGLKATWNETFSLDDIAKEIKSGKKLILVATDVDVGVNETIGTSKPIDYNTFMKSGVIPLKIPLFDKEGNGKTNMGHINISTEYTAPK